MIKSFASGLRRAVASGSSSPIYLRAISTSRAVASVAETPASTSLSSSTAAPSPSSPSPTPPMPGSTSASSSPASQSGRPSSSSQRPAQVAGLTRRTAYSPLSSMESPPFRLHVQSTRTNTILTLTDPYGNVLSGVSGGKSGAFKKAARSGYEAAYRASLTMFNTIGEKRIVWRMHKLELIWKGFGQGREAVYRALMANEGRGTRLLVSRMSDGTKLKVGGVRPKKRRML